MHGLKINNTLIEQVSSYKYLGILISSNLSWSPHINEVCSKARKTLGVIFRNFYRHTSPSVILQLYQSLVLPQLMYCSSVWDPPSSSGDSRNLENIQKFAIRLCSKNWSINYTSLRTTFNLPLLSSRRSYSKLITMYKIINHFLYFPPIITNQPTPYMCIRNFHSCNLTIPFCKTSSSLNSFIPATTTLWNSLPLNIKLCSSLSSFKYKLRNYLYV